MTIFSTIFPKLYLLSLLLLFSCFAKNELGSGRQAGFQAILAEDSMDDSSPRSFAAPATSGGRANMLKAASSEPRRLAAAPNKASSPPNSSKQQKLIYTGNIRFIAQDFAATRLFLDQMITRYDAYISSENQYLQEEREMAELELRIPAENFFPFIKALNTEMGPVESKSIYMEDVSLRYIDQEQRLASRKQEEQLLLSLLDKAGNLEDYLKVEERLARLREDLASLEGQFRYLKDQVAFATLRVSYYRGRPDGGTKPLPRPFVQDIFKALASGWHGVQWVFLRFVRLWPLWLLLLLGIVLKKLDLWQVPFPKIKNRTTTKTSKQTK